MQPLANYAAEQPLKILLLAALLARELQERLG
jgi:hypothetical protein